MGLNSRIMWFHKHTIIVLRSVMPRIAGIIPLLMVMAFVAALLAKHLVEEAKLRAS